MKTPLAWLNLTHNKLRTFVAGAGVTFAVVLVFMQLGFLGSVRATASMIYDALDFDLVIRSRRYLNLADTQSFPRSRLYQAVSVPEVRRATALHVGLNQWRNPNDGTKRRILVLGVTPGDPVFRVKEIQQKTELLHASEFVLIDRCSRDDFGPADGRKFGDADIGTQSEIGRQKVRIVGHFELGSGFAADGAVLIADRGFRRIQGRRGVDRVSLGLVKLKDGVDVEAAAGRLRDALPKDVEVLTREGMIRFERDIWLNEMSIGVIFRLGVIVAMVVGTAIVYQVLSSDVTKHLAEYATLKAIGYGGDFLSSLVLQQAIVLAVMGFLPGLAISVVLYRVTAQVANIPIAMNAGRVVLVLGLSVAMCTMSGLGALRKVRSSDPADLF